MRAHWPGVQHILPATAGVLVAVLSTSAILAPIVLGVDAIGCSDLLPTNRHLGVGIWSGTPDGAMANLEHQALHQCTTPIGIEISGSFTFSAVQGPGKNDIVQIGPGDCRSPGQCFGGMHVYFAYGRTKSSPGCNGMQDKLPLGIENGPWPAGTVYEVYHTSNVWNLYAGGALNQTIGEASICWTGNAAVWFGESWDKGDAIGGTAADHYFVTSTKTTQTEGGAFAFTNLNSSAPCNINDGGAAYVCDIVGPSSIAIWTSR